VQDPEQAKSPSSTLGVLAHDPLPIPQPQGSVSVPSAVLVELASVSR
jgi:hypothetical protein